MLGKYPFTHATVQELRVVRIVLSSNIIDIIKLRIAPDHYLLDSSVGGDGGGWRWSSGDDGDVCSCRIVGH